MKVQPMFHVVNRPNERHCEEYLSLFMLHILAVHVFFIYCLGSEFPELRVICQTRVLIGPLLRCTDLGVFTIIQYIGNNLQFLYEQFIMVLNMYDQKYIL